MVLIGWSLMELIYSDALKSVALRKWEYNTFVEHIILFKGYTNFCTLHISLLSIYSSMILTLDLKLKPCWQITSRSACWIYMQDHLLFSNPSSFSVPKNPFKIWLQLKATTAWTSSVSSTFPKGHDISQASTLTMQAQDQYCSYCKLHSVPFTYSRIKTDLRPGFNEQTFLPYFFSVKYGHQNLWATSTLPSQTTRCCWHSLIIDVWRILIASGELFSSVVSAASPPTSTHAHSPISSCWVLLPGCALFCHTNYWRSLLWLGIYTPRADGTSREDVTKNIQ